MLLLGCQKMCTTCANSSEKNLPYIINGIGAALSKCFVAVGSIEGVVGSKFQVTLPARGLLVKPSVE